MEADQGGQPIGEAKVRGHSRVTSTRAFRVQGIGPVHGKISGIGRFRGSRIWGN